MTKILVDSCVFINAMKEDSDHKDECRKFLEVLSSSGLGMTIPAHGWFEVWCNLKRIESENKLSSTSINGQWKFPVELIHIDADFISKYGNVHIPYAKAGDHIYLVVAYVNGYKLVTTDNGMAKVAHSLEISVFSPAEYLATGYATCK